MDGVQATKTYLFSIEDSYFTIHIKRHQSGTSARLGTFIQKSSHWPVATIWHSNRWWCLASNMACLHLFTRLWISHSQDWNSAMINHYPPSFWPPLTSINHHESPFAINPSFVMIVTMVAGLQPIASWCISTSWWTWSWFVNHSGQCHLWWFPTAHFTLSTSSWMIAMVDLVGGGWLTFAYFWEQLTTNQSRIGYPVSMISWLETVEINSFHSPS